MSDVKRSIHLLFEEMNEGVEKIVTSSPTADMATQGILDYVPEKVAMAAEGYMIDLYKALSTNTLNEPIFQNAANANKFYELQLRQKIASAYRFDVKDLQGYVEGKTFKETKILCPSAKAGVGGVVVGAVGSALLNLLSDTAVHISVWSIIADAVRVGLASAGITGISRLWYGASKKKGYCKAAQSFMADLENELMKWVDSVVDFYNSAVEELKATL